MGCWRGVPSVAVCLLALLAATPAAQPSPPTPPPAGPPRLEVSRLGFVSDHHVGSTPSAHFGVRLTNAGGGELQASVFVTSPSARFYVARPRDVTLGPGQSRTIDIRAPLYLLDRQSRFRENATASVMSNGGPPVLLPLTPELWPEPPQGTRITQQASGQHAWQAAPEDMAARLRVAALCAGVALVALWAVARLARRHVHGDVRAKPRLEAASGSDEEREEVLEAVRRADARAEARAAQKARELQEWHERAALPPLPAAEEGEAAGAGGSLCAVCLSRPRDTAVLPCRHVALCLPCARRLAADGPGGGATCPICRGALESYLQLFLVN